MCQGGYWGGGGGWGATAADPGRALVSCQTAWAGGRTNTAHKCTSERTFEPGSITEGARTEGVRIGTLHTITHAPHRQPLPCPCPCLHPCLRLCLCPHAGKRVNVDSEQAKNTGRSIPRGLVSLLGRRIFEPFETLVWLHPFSRAISSTVVWSFVLGVLCSHWGAGGTSTCRPTVTKANQSAKLDHWVPIPERVGERHNHIDKGSNTQTNEQNFTQGSKVGPLKDFRGAWSSSGTHMGVLDDVCWQEVPPHRGSITLPYLPTPPYNPRSTWMPVDMCAGVPHTTHGLPLKDSWNIEGGLGRVEHTHGGRGAWRHSEERIVKRGGRARRGWAARCRRSKKRNECLQ